MSRAPLSISKSKGGSTRVVFLSVILHACRIRVIFFNCPFEKKSFNWAVVACSHAPGNVVVVVCLKYAEGPWFICFILKALIAESSTMSAPTSLNFGFSDRLTPATSCLS